MSRAKIGCCCGCVIGFCMVFVLLFALAFGVYCWLCPEVWERTVDRIEGIWGGIKDEGDRLVDSARKKDKNASKSPEAGVKSE